MTLVVTTDVLGRARCEPVRLAPRRRRLSGLLTRHAPAGRPFIVSVHRKGAAYNITDDTVRLRASWKGTLLGPHDVVVITTLPRGGGGGGGGGGKASVGLAVASIALIALAPYLAPAILGGASGLASATAFTIGSSTVTYGTLLKVGLVIGGIGLGLAAQASSANKSTKEGNVRSLAGGGNLPRPGERKPLIYGRCWTQPPLSQRDATWYNGDEMILVKRLTLGLGKFQVHRIKVGTAEFWNETDGIVPPFTRPIPIKIGLGGFVDGVNPTSDQENTRSQIEILYEQPSTLMPGDVITSEDVAGQSLPRSTVVGDPVWSPAYRVAPLGQVVDKIHVDFQWPQGLGARKSSGARIANFGYVAFEARSIDALGNPTSSWYPMLDVRVGPLDTTKPVRRTFVQSVSESNYEVRGRNRLPEAEFATTEATWDGLRGHKNDTRIRQRTTEIVMRVRTGIGLSITSMSDVWVEATRIVPVWNGTTWVEQPEQRAIFAYADLVRADYGLNEPGGFDVAKAYADRTRLAPFDQFNGVIEGSPSFWEAASEILLPIRADPVKVGAVHSYVRDEPQNAPRHIISRRQIVRDSGSARYKLADGEGIGHVIVEYDRDGDPQRPDRVEHVVGVASRTPQRLKIKGLRTPEHALHLARWKAATGLYRGAERQIEMEWDGRLIYPGDLILSDVWFLSDAIVAGVASRSGLVLTLDVDVNAAPTVWTTYCALRTRAGREWGILRCRGIGVRGLELHPDDVSGLEGSTGLTLTNALAKETQDPTTIVIGSLSVLQKSYVARAAIPSSPDQVRVEMVRDDPRVWELLDEDYTPPPIGGGEFLDPLIPTLAVITARCVRVESGIELVWSVLPAPGARAYQVELAADGVSFEPIYAGPETAGARAMAHNPEITYSIRARPIGRTDIPGEWITTTFQTIPPEAPNALFDAIRVWNFVSDAEDITGASATLGVVDGWLQVTPTANDHGVLTPTGLQIEGQRYPLVQVRIRRLEGEGDWDGTVRYATSGHGLSASYQKTIPDPNLGVGQTATLSWDMAELTAGGTDWLGATIDQIRIDLGSSVESVFEIDWIAVGRIGPTDYASSITRVEAKADQATAYGEIRIVAEAAPSGFVAAYSWEIAALEVKAGMRALVTSGGDSVMVFSASQLFFEDPNVDGGDPQGLFSVIGGNVYFNGNVRIGGNLIVDGEVSTSKLSDKATFDTFMTETGATVDLGPTAGTPTLYTGAVSLNVTVPRANSEVTLFIEADLSALSDTPGATARMRIRRGSTEIDVVRIISDSRSNLTPAVFDTPGAGTFTYTIEFRCDFGGSAVDTNVRYRAIRARVDKA